MVRPLRLVCLVVLIALMMGLPGLPVAADVRAGGAPRAAVGQDSVSATFVVPSLPRKKKQRVTIDVALRAVGKERYSARLIVYKKGKVRAQILRSTSRGKLKKVGGRKVLLKKLRPGVPYQLRVSVVTEPRRVQLTARIWKDGSATGRTLTRRDYSSKRLARPGSASVASWGRKGVPAARVTLGAQAVETPSQAAPAQRQTGSAGQASTVPGLVLPESPMTAVLPDSTPIGSGQAVFVDPRGVDSAPGTIQQPVRTLVRAMALVGAGGQVVLRGGAYPVTENSVLVDRTKTGITVRNYPGEIPILDGAATVAGSARDEGSGIVSFAYAQVPAAEGEGYNLNWLPAATFSSGRPTGLAASVGWECVASDGRGHRAAAPSSADPDGCPADHKPRVTTAFYPDQVWVGGKPLTQVLTRGRVRPGFFYVQRAADSSAQTTRLYMSAQDSAKGSVRVSRPATLNLFRVDAERVTIRGLQVKGFSASWGVYPIKVFITAKGFRLRNSLIEGAAGVAIRVMGTPRGRGAEILHDVALDNVRIHYPGMKGLSATYVTGLALNRVEVVGTNPFGEFAIASAVHITKTHRTQIRKSVVRDGAARGIWFDQSSYDAKLVANRVERNGGEQVFYEFSHAMAMVGNLLVGRTAHAALRLSGSSDTKLVNNTVVGGKDSIWLYVDARSKTYYDTVHKQTRWCSEHRVRYGETGDPTKDCNVVYSGDYDMARNGGYSGVNLTPGMSWRPQITMMVNNVLGPSYATGHCSALVPVCISGWGKHAAGVNSIPTNQILPARAILDGNAYQSAGQLFQVWPGPDKPGVMRATSIMELQRTLSGSFYGMSRPEWHAQAGVNLTTGSGWPTSALEGLHRWAAPSPADARITGDLPAGSRHYGAFWR